LYVSAGYEEVGAIAELLGDLPLFCLEEGRIPHSSFCAKYFRSLCGGTKCYATLGARLRCSKIVRGPIIVMFVDPFFIWEVIASFIIFSTNKGREPSKEGGTLIA